VYITERLAAIPPGIGLFTMLRVLSCSCCNLQSLPAELGLCTSLVTLVCFSNNLSSLPAELGACTALQTLICNHNVIQTLPAELGACTALQVLDASHNRLASLPEELCACNALVFRLQHNRLTSLPEGIGACAALRHLDCSYNYLKSLPLGLGRLGDLFCLTEYGNPFVENSPTTIHELRACALRQTCASLVFCHEETQGDDAADAGARTRLGHVALDNVRDVVRLVWSAIRESLDDRRAKAERRGVTKESGSPVKKRRT
jgi:Leucine-rich repeat (LRR) protein